MAEAAFAKTFLTTIDSRPIKLPADHIEDAKKFPARPPYILPRMPNAMSKASSAAALPGSEPSIKVILRSLRNPPIDISLSSQPLTTSLHDVKQAVSSQARIPADKIKLLVNKRPVQDTKILRDVLGIEDGAAVPKSIEFAVMVLGGAASVLPAEDEKKAPVTGGPMPVDDSFWADLKAFLMQRLKDESLGTDMAETFKSSWASKTSAP